MAQRPPASVAGPFAHHRPAQTDGHKPKLSNGKPWLYCAVFALSIGLEATTYLNALTSASALHAIAITGCCGLVRYLLAVALLEKRLRRRF